MQAVNVHGGSADQSFKEVLNQLMQDVFGFSFQRFHELNVWGPEYEYFSLLDGNRMVGNIGVYTMDMVVNGQSQTMRQIGAVAVATDHRGQGLSRQLFEQVLERYPSCPLYLYCGDDVIDYYKKFGFHQADEFQPFLQTGALPKPGLNRDPAAHRRLDLSDAAVDRYLRQRSQFSSVLDCRNGYGINWFHLAYFHREHVYELPQLETMIVMEKQEHKLLLYDVIAAPGVSFAQIWDSLPLVPVGPDSAIEEVYFGFCPDALGVESGTVPFLEEDSHLMVRGWDPQSVGGFLPRLTRT